MSATNQSTPSNNGDKLNTLSTILDLQQYEKQLFTNLEELANNANNNNSAQQNQIINNINNLSQTRINLFNSLKDLYQYAQDNVSENRTELVDKMVVAKVMESQLNNMKNMMNELDQIKNNKLRMVQINTYYGKQYQAQTNLMQFIIKICAVIIILIFLTKMFLIPQQVSYVLLIIVISVGGFFIFRKVSDISSRDKMDFDRYESPSMQGKLSNTYEYDKDYSSLDINMWSICGEGTAFNNDLGQCVIKPVESFSIMNNDVVGYNKEFNYLSGPKEI